MYTYIHIRICTQREEIYIHIKLNLYKMYEAVFPIEPEVLDAVESSDTTYYIRSDVRFDFDIRERSRHRYNDIRLRI